MDNKMKACFLIFCLLAAISVSLLTCSVKTTSPDNLGYEESDSGRTVTISLNESFKLTLVATGSSSWYENPTIDDESVIEQTDYETKAGGTAILPIVNQIWTFKAVGTGEATLTNKYGGIHGNIKSFTLNIVVE